MQIDGKEILISGKITRIAAIRDKDEWFEEVNDPKSLINLIKNSLNADIFTFWQKFPHTEPKYDYYMEWDNVAAIPISSYDNWFKKQIQQNPRNKIRKAAKKGVIVELVDFNDKLIQGIADIFNETPIRQGRPFGHYGKDFDTIKLELSDRLSSAVFLGAYYRNELIGFAKLINAGTFMRMTPLISKIAHRDRAPNNVLLAKAVELTCEKDLPYFIYGKFVYGHSGESSLTDFKRYNGFEKIDVPRYYVPLNSKGNLAIALKLHHGIRGILPEKTIRYLIDLRKKWYSRKI